MTPAWQLSRRACAASRRLRQVHTPFEVKVPVRAQSRLRPLIGATRYAELEQTGSRARAVLGGITVWNVSSTADGGGVAEMLHVLVGYILNAGVDVRWVVLSGDEEFFRITKRIHNRLHGFSGDDGELGPAEAAHYRGIAEQNAEGLSKSVHAGDVVLLHDPQSLGLAEAVSEIGAIVVWRSHIGTALSNRWTEDAWTFLRPHLGACRAFVFSRESYAPSWLPAERVTTIHPSIDPFSPKNQGLADPEVRSILTTVGVLAGPDVAQLSSNGKPRRRRVTRRAAIVADGPPLDPETPVVIQVSRWDRLKDMQGVMEGFAEHGILRNEAHLVLAGPAVAGVTDDPEGAEVLEECVAAWESLPIGARRRVRLVALPMVNVRENAVMVNALQRHASVIVQKSLAEGFGLTVAEGMWKAKAVVASAVGGIIDQIAPDTGILLEDPTDLDAYGRVLAWLLERPGTIADLGARARQRVLEDFVGDKHLIAYAKLIERLVIPGLAPAGVLGSADTAAPPD